MGSSSGFSRPDYAGDYAQHRLGHRRDDRCTEAKQRADAELRGRLGPRRANEIIDAIDKIKSRR
jgi:hypothetical protein